MKSFLSFLISKAFIKQLIVAIIIVMASLLGSMLFLKIYTHHGKAYAVPDLTGLSSEEAAAKLADSEMRFVVSDSLFVATAAPGSVVDQVPAVGQKVKQGRKIFVTICAQEPAQVAMPQLTDISLRHAEGVLKSAGLTLGRIEHETSEYEGLVLDQKIDGQSIAAGDPVSKGVVVDLVVGKRGYISKVAVPQLRGASKDSVIQILNSKQLNVGAVIYDETVLTAEDTMAARVWRQRPFADVPNAQIEHDGIVDVWLTADSTKYMPVKDDEVEIIYEDEVDVNGANFDDF